MSPAGKLGRTVAQLLQRGDGGQGGDVHSALLQRVQGLGLPEEALVQLLLQWGQAGGGTAKLTCALKAQVGSHVTEPEDKRTDSRRPAPPSQEDTWTRCQRFF